MDEYSGPGVIVGESVDSGALAVAFAGWLGFWGAFALGDYIADKHGLSLCTSARWCLHLDNPRARLAFTGVYGTGSVALLVHLVKRSAITDLKRRRLSRLGT